MYRFPFIGDLTEIYTGIMPFNMIYFNNFQVRLFLWHYFMKISAFYSSDANQSVPPHVEPNILDGESTLVHYDIVSKIVEPL